MPTIAKLVNFAILVGAARLLPEAPVGDVSAHAQRNRAPGAGRSSRAAVGGRAAVERRAVAAGGAARPSSRALRRHGEEELVHERARMKAATEKTASNCSNGRGATSICSSVRRAANWSSTRPMLAMKLARRRLEQTITRDDQSRLIDQYAAEVQA